MLSLLLDNAARSGGIANMTIEEFERARVQGNDRIVVVIFIAVFLFFHKCVENLNCLKHNYMFRLVYIKASSIVYSMVKCGLFIVQITGYMG